MKALGVFLLMFGLLFSTPMISIAQKVVDEPLSVVEKMPEFPGGVDAMMRFLGKTIVYPKKAIEQVIEGRVYVQFIVGKRGKLSEFEVVRGIHPLLDSTALAAAKQMPKWKPARNEGKRVKVKCVIPIEFKLEPSN